MEAIRLCVIVVAYAPDTIRSAQMMVGVINAYYVIIPMPVCFNCICKGVFVVLAISLDDFAQR